MKKVIFPLRKGDTGSEVVNLQDALSLMIEKGAIKPGTRDLLRTWKKGLSSERSGKVYGTTTVEFVKHFQRSQGVPKSGQVKKNTAAAINKLLQEWGLINQPPEPEAAEYLIQGQVLQADATPLAGVLVRTFTKELRSEKMLAQAFTDRRGKYSITCTHPLSEEGINLIIRFFDRQKNLLASSRTIFNAGASETVDIQIAEESKRLTSKYERITKTLQSLLAERPIRELREDEEDNPGKGVVPAKQCR
jgi:hypothetical protein